MGFDWVAKKNYKRHYICLNCQKGFKRAAEDDMKDAVDTNLSNLMNEYYASKAQQDIVNYIDEAYQKAKVVCPNCQSKMLQVDYNFEVPAQRDHKSWKKLQETLSPKMTPNYAIYIQWHRLEIQKADANSVESKILKENQAKLERM
ncbi:MAG: hypothetical protein R2753_15440 [Chitinophagales bacterium]